MNKYDRSGLLELLELKETNSENLTLEAILDSFELQIQYLIFSGRRSSKKKHSLPWHLSYQDHLDSKSMGSFFEIHETPDFRPLVHWITLKGEFLNACGCQQDEATITLILNTKNHNALITTFRDLSQKVSFLAILSTFGLATSEAGGFSACSILLNVVHTTLYTHTRNKKHLIWSYDQAISTYFEGSDFGPFWTLLDSVTLEPDFSWTCSFQQNEPTIGLYSHVENQKKIIKTSRKKSERVRILAILTPFWAITLEPDFTWTCSFHQNERTTDLYSHVENQKKLMIIFRENPEKLSFGPFQGVLSGP